MDKTRILEAYQLYQQGLSLRQIAARTGISNSTLSLNFRQLGLPRRDKSAAMLIAISSGRKRVPRGPEAGSWKGGKPSIDTLGYVRLRAPDHPKAAKDGRVYEHIVVLENKLGRPLLPSEVAHHLDGNKVNNHPNNLIVMSRSEHMRHHRPQRKPQIKHVPLCHPERPYLARGLCFYCYHHTRRYNRVIEALLGAA